MENEKNTEAVQEEEKDVTPETETAPKEESKLFTQEDVNKIVADRVARESKKTEKLIQEKLDEAEKLRQMNAEEKQKYEDEKKERTIAELESRLNRVGLEKEVTAMFTAKGIPYDENLVTGSVKDDAEATKVFVNALIETINTVADAKVNEMLKGKTPKKMENRTNGVMTKSDFSKLSYSERAELYNNNRELYDSLNN